MPALNHVITWNRTRHHWDRITAHDASIRFQGNTVRADYKVFYCELCKQPVLLTAAGKKQSHFRHSKHEDDKNCPERMFNARPVDYDPQDFALPLKLDYDQRLKRIHLFLGLFAPKGLIARFQAKTGWMPQFRIVSMMGGTEEPKPDIYSFDRLAEAGITYFRLRKIADAYSLHCDDAIRRELHWPAKVSGVPEPAGCMFDEASTKRIPADGDIEIGQVYRLLTSRDVLRCKGVDIAELPLTTDPGWRLFRIKPTEYCAEAAKFFMRWQLRLTEAPVRLFPLWPMTVKRPYLIERDSRRPTLFYARGDATRHHVVPQDLESSVRESGGNPALIEIAADWKRLLITSGRTSVLKYVFLDECKLPKITSPRRDLCRIETLQGDLIAGEALPKGCSQVCAKVRFNGMAEIHSDKVVISRIELRPEKASILTIKPSEVCRIFVGCDLIRTLSHIKSLKTDLKHPLLKLQSFDGREAKAQETAPLPHSAWTQLLDNPQYKRLAQANLLSDALPFAALRGWLAR